MDDYFDQFESADPVPEQNGVAPTGDYFNQFEDAPNENTKAIKDAFDKNPDVIAARNQGSMSGFWNDLAKTLPLYGSIDAAKEGYRQGTELLGNNPAGMVGGVLQGANLATQTVFNPLMKSGESYMRGAQALGQTIAQNPMGAQHTLTGSEDIFPHLKDPSFGVQTGSESGDTFVNGLLNSFGTGAVGLAKNPVAPAIGGVLIPAAEAKYMPVKGTTTTTIGDPVLVKKYGKMTPVDIHEVLDSGENAILEKTLPRTGSNDSAAGDVASRRALGEAIRKDPEGTTNMRGVEAANKAVMDDIGAAFNRAGADNVEVSTQTAVDRLNALRAKYNIPEGSARDIQIKNAISELGGGKKISLGQAANEEQMANAKLSGHYKTGGVSGDFESVIKKTLRNAYSDIVDEGREFSGIPNAKAMSERYADARTLAKRLGAKIRKMDNLAKVGDESMYGSTAKAEAYRKVGAGMLASVTGHPIIGAGATLKGIGELINNNKLKAYRDANFAMKKINQKINRKINFTGAIAPVLSTEQSWKNKILQRQGGIEAPMNPDNPTLNQPPQVVRDPSDLNNPLVANKAEGESILNAKPEPFTPDIGIPSAMSPEEAARITQAHAGSTDPINTPRSDFLNRKYVKVNDFKGLGSKNYPPFELEGNMVVPETISESGEPIHWKVYYKVGSGRFATKPEIFNERPTKSDMIKVERQKVFFAE